MKSRELHMDDLAVVSFEITAAPRLPFPSKPTIDQSRRRTMPTGRG